MRDLLKITKALADDTRLRVLLALRTDELCACQITELFGLSPSTMSKHLSILSRAGLVASRKAGRWVYFRLPDAKAPASVARALEWISESAQGSERVQEDTERLKRILKIDPSEICRRQCQ